MSLEVMNSQYGHTDGSLPTYTRGIARRREDGSKHSQLSVTFEGISSRSIRYGSLCRIAKLWTSCSGSIFVF